MKNCCMVYHRKKLEVSLGVWAMSIVNANVGGGRYLLVKVRLHFRYPLDDSSLLQLTNTVARAQHPFEPTAGNVAMWFRPSVIPRSQNPKLLIYNLSAFCLNRAKYFKGASLCNDNRSRNRQAGHEQDGIFYIKNLTFIAIHVCSIGRITRLLRATKTSHKLSMIKNVR